MKSKLSVLPHYNQDGSPDFSSGDESRRQRCAIERRCWACDKIIGRYTAFIGSHTSITQRRFLECPMHKTCALEAIRLHDSPLPLGLLISRGFQIVTMPFEDSFVWFFQPFTPDAEPVQWHVRQPNTTKEPHGHAR